MADLGFYLSRLVTSYSNFIKDLGNFYGTALNLLVLSIAITLVSLFIWEFYNSISRRNLISLNLNKYNRNYHRVASKFFASLFYFIEYIIVVPFLILLWFAALSIILLVIAPERTVTEVMFVSAAIVASTRILSYRKHEISKDLAKLFPFIALSLFLLSPNPFNLAMVAVQFSEIGTWFSNILSYLVVVFLIEIILRLFYTIFEFWQSEDKAEKEDS